MQPIGKARSYLVRTQHGYCFRARVPADIQGAVGKRELRYSLRTGSLGAAKRRAGLLAGMVWKLFDIVRGGRVKLTEAEITDIIEDYKEFVLGEFDDELHHRGVGADSGTRNGFIAYEVLVSRIAWLRRGLQADGQNHWIDAYLDRLPKVDKGGGQYEELRRRMARGAIAVLEDEESRQAYRHPELNLPGVFGQQQPQGGASAKSEAADTPGILLADLWKDYTKDKVDSKKWVPGTVTGHQQKFNTLVQVVGNIPVNEVTKGAIDQYRRVLDLLPVGFSKVGYADLSGLKPEDLEGKHPRTLDTTTVRHYMNLARALFAFAVDNDYITVNPVLTGKIPSKKRNTREQRSPFTPEDLARIFDPAVFLKWSRDSPARFFIPLVLLYTGARLEEVAGLYREDVVTDEGVPCIDINTDHGRGLKTLHATRVIPLHPDMVEWFRFTRWAASVGEGPLFGELKAYRGKYGHDFSKRFGAYLRKTVGITDKRKVLHSFRHTVADQLYKNEVEESLIEELQGRAGKTLTATTYVGGHLTKSLYGAVRKLAFDLDFCGLEQSTWVTGLTSKERGVNGDGSGD